MAKPTTKHQEALQFLDDLDNLSSAADLEKDVIPVDETVEKSSGQAADVLAFIDEVTQKSSEPTKPSTSRITLSRPSSRASNNPPLKKKSSEHARSSTPVNTVPHPSAVPPPAPASKSSDQTVNSTGAWGWSSVWSSTTAVIQQARSVVDDQVKTLSSNEQARKFQEGVRGYVKTAQLDRIGKDLKEVSMSALTDILNAVAPPISEHEVLKVWLSHDMQGYDGVESIVYQALSRVMEQVESGDLVVNRGSESKPKPESTEKTREMNIVEGLDAALKLAQASIAELVKGDAVSPTSTLSTQNPTVYTSLYLRLQPFTSSVAAHAVEVQSERSDATTQIQFLIYMTEPSHSLTHFTVSQAFLSQWLEIWDTNEWVEDLIVETLRLGIQVVGQEYIIARMGLNSKAPKGKSRNSSNTLATP